MDKKIFNNQYPDYIFIFLDGDKKLHYLERTDQFKAKSIAYLSRLQAKIVTKIQNEPIFEEKEKVIPTEEQNEAVFLTYKQILVETSTESSNLKTLQEYF